MPEPVRISSVESYGDVWQVDAIGLRTRQFYPGTILTSAELPRLRITAASVLDFSSDAEAFHLAIEAQRIRLAHEVDPHFAVSSSSITPLPHQLEVDPRAALRDNRAVDRMETELAHTGTMVDLLQLPWATIETIKDLDATVR